MKTSEQEAYWLLMHYLTQHACPPEGFLCLRSVDPNWPRAEQELCLKCWDARIEATLDEVHHERREP